jgi:RNA polymerase sigma factor (sigma-70 family)
MTDNDPAELVGRAAGGDRAAWDALVSRYASLVWSVARAHRLSDADAADVSQTTWLRLVENLGSLREPDRVGSWLVTTARRECLRLLRTSGRETPADVIDLDLPDESAVAVDAAILERERSAALWASFDRISDPCRRLLRVLMATPPPSYDEVSAALGMPVGSIGPTRARCLGALRKQLGTTGITAPSGGSA